MSKGRLTLDVAGSYQFSFRRGSHVFATIGVRIVAPSWRIDRDFQALARSLRCKTRLRIVEYCARRQTIGLPLRAKTPSGQGRKERTELIANVYQLTAFRFSKNDRAHDYEGTIEGGLNAVIDGGNGHTRGWDAASRCTSAMRAEFNVAQVVAKSYKKNWPPRARPKMVLTRV